MEHAKKNSRVWIEKAELKSLAIIGILFLAAFIMLAFSNIFS